MVTQGLNNNAGKPDGNIETASNQSERQTTSIKLFMVLLSNAYIGAIM